MFTPTLRLVPEGQDIYSLQAEFEVPDTCYSAAGVKREAPSTHPVGAGVIAYQFLLSHAGALCGQIVRRIHQTAEQVEAKPGSVITAFVVLEGRVLGSSSIVAGPKGVTALPLTGAANAGPHLMASSVALGAARPPLTANLCQAIVVKNTPAPQNFKSPDQVLSDLGVIDGIQTKAHQAGIQSDLNKIGWHILQSAIPSGPAVSVSDCSDSVETHAF